MRKYLVIAILIVILFVVSLFVFRKHGKTIWLKIAGRRNEVPSMLSALPFEKENTPQGRHKVLASRLRPNQIYLAEILFTPQHTPRGAYVSLSLVVEFADPHTAQKFKKKKDLFANLLVEYSSRWDYLDFKNADGLALIKEDIFSLLKKKVSPKITKVYLVEYKFYQQKKL